MGGNQRLYIAGAAALLAAVSGLSWRAAGAPRQQPSGTPSVVRPIQDPFRPIRRTAASVATGRQVRPSRQPAQRAGRPAPPALSTVPRQISDAIDFAIEASRKAHGVVTTGSVRHDSFRVGNLTLPVAGIRLSGGQSLKASIAAPSAKFDATLLLTIATPPADYGRRQSFTVRLDGREAFSADETDPGAGPERSYFLDFSPTAPKVTVEIEVGSAAVAPITVSSLRCYAGLTPAAVQKALAEGPVKERMGLALVSPKEMGYGLDVESMRSAFRSLPASPYLEEQVAVLYNFSARNAAQNRAEIDRLAEMARLANIPLRIAFQMHWAGVPRGVPDGAGGTFIDLPYQQITFDPDDKVDDPGLAALMGDRNDVRYGLSVPNVWSDTPWLTHNHPRLNQLRRIRLTQALHAWRDARERLADEGRARLLPGHLSTGDETIYWAQGVDDRKYTETNGGKPRANLSADFNPFTVADAIAEGVNLDPRDGLDTRERLWLHHNLARQQQRIVDWMFAALPPEPITLNQGSPQFGVDLVRRNIFTEPYGMPLYPLNQNGAHHPGLELGYARNGRSGGQYWSGEILPWLLKARERGRIALPNLECTGAPPPQLTAALRAAYACGARYATLYNWDKGSETLKAAQAFASSIEKPAMESYPSTQPGISSIASAVPTAGQTGSNRWEREYTAGPEAFGINRVDLFGMQVPAPIPARVTLRGSNGMAWTVTGILKPASGRPITSSFMLPSLFPQHPGEKYTVTLEIDSATIAEMARAADGKLAVRLASDIFHERTRSRAIAEWRDAADILGSLRDIHRSSVQPLVALEALIRAQALFRDWRPREAYTAAIRAEQLALPSSFSLQPPGGRLNPYWVKIDCPGGPVTATITAYTNSRATVSLRSATAQTVTVSRGGAKTTAALSPNIAVEITLDLAPQRN